MRKTIAINDKPEMFIAEISNQDNIGILTKDGKRKVITTDGTFFQVTCPRENRVSAGTLPDKTRRNQRELVRYYRDSNGEAIKGLYRFDSTDELMTWALEIPNSKRDVQYL